MTRPLFDLDDALRHEEVLGLPSHSGELAWQVLRQHVCRNGREGAAWAPVWKGLTMPATMPWRLRVLDGSGEQATVLLEQAQLR